VPELAGRYLYTDLCTGGLRSIALGQPLASDDRADGPTMTSPQSFGQDSSCELYVTNGNVLDKIVSTAPPPVPAACPATAATTTATPHRKCKKRHRKKKHHAVAAKKHKKHKKHCKKKRRKKHHR
jgi:hypothetical protein